MRHIWRAAVCLAAILVLSTCYSAATFTPGDVAAQQEPNYNYYILDHRPLQVDSLEVWIQELEECAGTERPTDAALMLVEARVIVVTIATFGLDPLDTVAGLWLAPDYNTSGMHLVVVIRDFPGDLNRLLKHELLHYVTQLPHPDVNPVMAQCLGEGL